MKKLLLALGLVGALAATAITAPDPVATQVEQGKKLYTDKCSKCHGAAGQGTKDGPPVVGKDAFPLDPRPKAKRDVKFHTAADVFAWASKNMPAKKPGTLTTDQYLAIFAFDLTANGIKLDKPLDGAAAAKIVLHP
ncbi:MAG: c-type cytochrome [Kofleriaceae bacterium]